MIVRRASRSTLVACTALVALGGCSRTRAHQGYVMDNALVASIAPGIDNRASVQKTLGDPSFPGQFDPATWYYVSRTTRRFSFGLPKPIQQTVLAVHFDAAGTVASVQRTGLDQIVRLSPSGDKTPTLGRERGLFQELFGNIGAVGGGRGANAPTTDNPGGGTGP